MVLWGACNMNIEIKKEQSFMFLIIIWLMCGWCNMQSMFAMTSNLALTRAQKKVASSAQIEMPKTEQKQPVNISGSLSEEQKKELLRKALEKIPKDQRRFLTGDKVIGILRPSGQTQQVSEQPVKDERIIRLERELTDFENQLNSPSVNLAVIQNIERILYNRINKELMELPLPDNQLRPLRERASALGEQLKLFDALFRLVNYFKSHVDHGTVTDEIIDIVQQKLNVLRKDVKGLNEKAQSSLNQKMDELVQQIEQQRDAQRSEIERYLTMLENALKRDSVNAEIIKNIRISIGEVIDNKKLILPVNQQEMIKKRISNLNALVSLFEKLISIENSVAQGGFILATLGDMAKQMNDLSTSLKDLKLPEEQSVPVHKRIVHLESQLTNLLEGFLVQLKSEAEAMSQGYNLTLDQIEKMSALLRDIKDVRSNFILSGDQASKIDELLKDVEDLLTREQAFLEKELEQKRIQLEREQEELKKQKDQELRQEFLAEGATKGTNVVPSPMVSTEPQEEKVINSGLPVQLVQESGSMVNEKLEGVQKPEAKVSEKLEEKRVGVTSLGLEMQSLLNEFNLAYQRWFDRQQEEDALRKFYMGLSRRTTDQERSALQKIVADLEDNKNYIKPLIGRIGEIDQKLDQFLKQPEHKESELVKKLMHDWQKVLTSIEELSEKTHGTLFEQNQQKKKEGKASSLPFIKRNEVVLRDIAELLGRIGIIKIANRNKLNKIEPPSEQLQAPQQCISKKRLRRQGAFSKYF